MCTNLTTKGEEMNIRMPISIEENLRFCSSEFKMSYPEIGKRAYKCFCSNDIKPMVQEKGLLSKEGYNMGDKPACLSTNEFRAVIVWYIERAMERHNEKHVPLSLDECTFETDEQQLLIQMAQDRIISFVEGLDENIANQIREKFNV